MREIELKEAKATLSAVLDAAHLGQQFAITRHGRKDAVVISWDAWKRLSNVPSFGQLLVSAPFEDGDLPDRNPSPLRDAGF